VEEVVEVLVGDRVASISPGLHVSPPGIDHSINIGVVGAVNSREGTVDEVDVVLLSDRATLVGAGSNNVLIDISAESGCVGLLSDGRVVTVAASEGHNARGSLASSGGDAASLAPDIGSRLDLAQAVSGNARAALAIAQPRHMDPNVLGSRDTFTFSWGSPGTRGGGGRHCRSCQGESNSETSELHCDKRGRVYKNWTAKEFRETKEGKRRLDIS
jgi:hypothetical protein